MPFFFARHGLSAKRVIFAEWRPTEHRADELHDQRAVPRSRLRMPDR
jgi:hypothetical protein